MSRNRVRRVCRRHAATALAAPVWQTGCAMAVPLEAWFRAWPDRSDINVMTASRPFTNALECCARRICDRPGRG